MTIGDALQEAITAIMQRRNAASGQAVFVDEVILLGILEKLVDRVAQELSDDD